MSSPALFGWGRCAGVFSAFDAGKVWDRIAGGGLTLFMAVPTIYVKLIDAWEKASAAERERMSEGCRRMRLMARLEHEVGARPGVAAGRHCGLVQRWDVGMGWENHAGGDAGPPISLSLNQARAKHSRKRIFLDLGIRLPVWRVYPAGVSAGSSLPAISKVQTGGFTSVGVGEETPRVLGVRRIFRRAGIDPMFQRGTKKEAFRQSPRTVAAGRARMAT